MRSTISELAFTGVFAFLLCVYAVYVLKYAVETFCNFQKTIDTHPYDCKVINVMYHKVFMLIIGACMIVFLYSIIWDTAMVIEAFYVRPTILPWIITDAFIVGMGHMGVYMASEHVRHLKKYGKLCNGKEPANNTGGC